MKAIIPIGGRGTRMRPVTFTANKHFIPVGNKPLIFYPIEAVVEAGIKDIAITYNPGQLELGQKFLGDGSKWGINLTYILQEKPLGLANIFQVCEEWIGNDLFVLHLGDNIFPDGIIDQVNYFIEKKPSGLVVYVHHKENTRLGVPILDEEGNLKEYVEKPKNPPNDFGIPGLYFFSPDVYRCFEDDPVKPSARGEYEIGDAYNWLVRHGHTIESMEIKSPWLDPGKFDDWLETNQYLLDKNIKKEILSEVSDDTRVEGRVSIGENCKVINSVVRGPVSIANDVVIENSFVGPYTSIDHNCVIEGCHLENSVLMESVHISHVTKPIDSSIIGPSAEVYGNEKTVSMELFLGEMSRVTL